MKSAQAVSTFLAVLAALPWAVSGCSQPQRDTATPTTGDQPMALTITTTAFMDGGPIPPKYTGDGADISPPLLWSDLPDEVVTLALICDDPDAPTATPWVTKATYHNSPERA